MAYGLDVNGRTEWDDDFMDEPPAVHVSFPGEEGVTEYRCTKCDEVTQDEPAPDCSVNVDPESLCDSTQCDQCEGSGELYTAAQVSEECATCAGTGNGAHDWQAEAHSWLNSAWIRADEDRVTVAISVGDPRGAFTLSVERMEDGTLRLSAPYPGESMPHMPLTPLGSPGYYQVGS